MPRTSLRLASQFMNLKKCWDTKTSSQPVGISTSTLTSCARSSLMKQFKSFLAPQFERYISYRQHLGYETQNSWSHLLMFDCYLVELQMEQGSFTPAFFLQLRKRLPWQPSTINRVLSTLRVFFQYLVRQGDFKENPLKDVPPLKELHYLPFVFSPEQIDQLLNAVYKRIRKNRAYYLKDVAIYLAVLLLARCGLRISEPLKLLIGRYRPG